MPASQINAPVLFVSHGGGPLPLLNDPGHAEMISAFEEIKADLPQPTAVIVISAHWESPVFTVGANAQPSLIYDYSGFPAQSYQYQYPVPGDKAIAEQAVQLLRQHGLPVQQDPQRDLDHGVFVPMMLLYAEAEVPVIPISLQKHLDAEQHIRLGQALKPLREQGVMIVGSGFTFHNIPLFFESESERTQQQSRAFTAWLDELLAASSVSEAQRTEQLANWAKAPGARLSHPREEHLLPVHSCYGAAGAAVSQIYAFDLMGIAARCYRWD